jgi:hypothetical protein
MSSNWSNSTEPGSAAPGEPPRVADGCKASVDLGLGILVRHLALPSQGVKISTDRTWGEAGSSGPGKFIAGDSF